MIQFKHALAYSFILLNVIFHQHIYAELKSGPMVGHTTHESSSVWAYAGKDKNVQLRYGEANKSRARYKEIAMPPREANNFTSLAEIKGLTPLTKYRYEVLVDGKVAGKGKFKTAPLPYKATKFSYVFTSCMSIKVQPEQPAWDALIKQNADLHLMLGDNVYPDSTDHDVIWKHHMKQRSLKNFARHIASLPNYATWDDHDFGPNDSHGLTPGKENSLRAFKNVWANPSYGNEDTPGVFYSFYWADVHFIVLDDRYYRDDERGPKVPEKTQFGKKQLEWFFKTLKESRGTFKVVCNGYDIMGARYPHEIRVIADNIRENKIDGVLFHSGDIHRNEFKQQDHGMGYKVTQITSSGIGKNKNRPWVKIEVDTTAEDPKLKAYFYTQEKLSETHLVNLSMLQHKE